jgi:hypothetical protein
MDLCWCMNLIQKWVAASRTSQIGSMHPLYTTKFNLHYSISQCLTEKWALTLEIAYDLGENLRSLQTTKWGTSNSKSLTFWSKYCSTCQNWTCATWKEDCGNNRPCMVASAASFSSPAASDEGPVCSP